MESLRAMLAVLSRQHSDDLAGELFVQMYQRQLADQPEAAIWYLVDQATRTCRWFPTIAECLEIISGWRRHDADTMRRALATRLYYRERAARLPPTPPPGEEWQPTREELDAIKAMATRNLRA